SSVRKHQNRGRSFRGLKSGTTKHSRWFSESRAPRENYSDDLSGKRRQAAGPNQELRQVFIAAGNRRAGPIDFQTRYLNHLTVATIDRRAATFIDPTGQSIGSNPRTASGIAVPISSTPKMAGVFITFEGIDG